MVNIAPSLLRICNVSIAFPLLVLLVVLFLRLFQNKSVMLFYALCCMFCTKTIMSLNISKNKNMYITPAIYW